MQPAHQEMSQAEFAREMGVSRAAVSQWKAKDILRDDAFTQPGKKGKVVFHVAVEQVRRNRDLGQSLGNGVGTRIDPGETPKAADAPAQPALLPDPVCATDERPPAADEDAQKRSNTVQDQLVAARLEQQLRKNRIEASEEALRQGQLLSAEEARAQMARIAGLMLQIFEGALPDFASKVAEKFDVPQRDVLHLLREEFRKVRRDAAKKERERSAETPQSGAANIESDD